MVIHKGNGNKIIPEGVSREGNRRDLNLLNLARDIRANGMGIVRSKSTVEELQRLDSNIIVSSFDHDAQMFNLYYKY